MRHSALGVLAAVVLALMVDGASAATTVKSGKSNTSDKLDASACAANGGVYATEEDGSKVCITAIACKATTVKGSKSNSSERIDTNVADAVRACFDACGAISKDGSSVCTKPESPAPAAAPKEDTN